MFCFLIKPCRIHKSAKSIPRVMVYQTGVLLVNLGTPQSPQASDVRRYLLEFLTDKRVIDFSWLWRQILVRGLIIPSRYHQSAKSYAHIWTEQGSPLLVHGFELTKALQDSLGEDFKVELAMRYQTPSIEESLARLMKLPLRKLIVIPLFPQYASATTGSVNEKVMNLLSRHTVIPEVTFIQQFATFPPFIEALIATAKSLNLSNYDHILFSYHGLPQRHIKKADIVGTCLRQGDCCHSLGSSNAGCYAAQCFATTRAVVEKLNIPKERYSLSFQSRLGKEPWLQPYTGDSITQLAKEGKKRVLVFCPSFVCDCLETLHEIGVEYAAEFKQAGGDVLELVPGLNQHPVWVQALKQLVHSNDNMDKQRTALQDRQDRSKEQH
jgi:protoporphyrin/coproporphyrin ferrochelatase